MLRMVLLLFGRIHKNDAENCVMAAWLAGCLAAGWLPGWLDGWLAGCITYHLMSTRVRPVTMYAGN